MAHDFIPFARPDTGEEERAAMVAVLRSGWLTSGEECRRFEAEFAESVGAKHAVALNSCTAAMHLALEAIGVGADDVVVTTPYTFAATAEVIRYMGATPVFADIDARTFNIDTDQLADVVARERNAGKNVRAVMPVHIAGHPCDQDAIAKVAEANDLAIIEDAAHSFPASFRGQAIGTSPGNGVRHAARFSFYATKTITTGEGGMLTSDDADLVARARVMSLHGISAGARDRYTKGGSWEYDILAPGYKYNLTDLAAALGRAQLRHAQQMSDRRAEIAQAYNQAFGEIAALETPTVLDDVTTSWHLYQLRVDVPAGADQRETRLRFTDRLREEGVGCSVHFIPLHLHSYYVDLYGYAPDDFPVAHREFLREISLPIYSSMSDDEVARVISVVKSLAQELL